MWARRGKGARAAPRSAARKAERREGKQMGSEGGGKVYLSFHKSFVREGVPYVDRATGEERTLNSVTLPSDTVIDGRPVGGFRFSPLFVDRSRFDEDQRVVPLLADREVRLTRVARDAEGNVVLGDDGEPVREELRVRPQQIKDALTEARRAWAQQHAQGRSLRERAGAARDGADSLGRGGARQASRDVPN